MDGSVVDGDYGSDGEDIKMLPLILAVNEVMLPWEEWLTVMAVDGGEIIFHGSMYVRGFGLGYTVSSMELTVEAKWIRFWIQLNPYKDASNRADTFSLIACLMWFIWESRNDLVHNVKSEEPAIILARAKSMMLSSIKIPSLQGIFAISPPQPASPWVVPPKDWAKINTDGAWNPNSLNGGIGFILRDSNYKFVYARSTYLVCFSAEEAETISISDALMVDLEKRLDPIIVESDALAI
ncbi:uncharacterized protein LOC113312590 [Papaver somniferum]|uniref:uncharacterized protein LOC113312590 n=1 Tax=Papaver somniferum TaxID=3469 RepID=UPI000E6FC16B|nr:uncharacterized protein LOC113312590 [Papaver somniferum]